jgi:hypothetical protein
MRFEVPQFIEVEDKIVGPLTWKQFVYLAGGAGLLIIFYFTFPFFIFAIVGLPLGALAGFLAFHKVNNRPFSIFLESFINYTTQNKLYLWEREEEQTVGTEIIVSNGPEIAPSTPGKSRIASLSEKLEFYSHER